MSVRWLPILLLAACGRIGFDGVELAIDDAPPCLGIGHDEDADGVDDACDVCPQTADVAQADRDGDQVGDACDPHPDDAIDQIVVFDPFTSLDPAWEFPSTQPTFTGDSIVGDSRMGQFRADRTGAPATDRYTFAVQIHDANMTGQRQLALYAIESDAQVYFCDLDESSSGIFFAQVFTLNGANYSSQTTSDSTRSLVDAGLTMMLDHEPARWTCRTDWPVDTPVLASPLPADGQITPTGVALSAIRLEVEITSFFHVHSN